MGVLDSTTVAVELRQDHGFSLLVLMLTVFIHYWLVHAASTCFDVQVQCVQVCVRSYAC